MFGNKLQLASVVLRTSISHFIDLAETMEIDRKLIDEQAALEALCGDKQLLCELAKMFLEDAPGMLVELDAAVSAGEFIIAKRLVHSLRGLSSTFFAKSVTELARRLEDDLNRGVLDSLNNGGLERLTSAIDELSRELKASDFAN